MLRAVIPSRSSYYPYSSPFLRFSSSELSISSAHCRYRASSSPVAQHAFPHGRLSAATEFVFFVVTACMLLSGSSTAPGPLAIIGEHLTPSRPVTHVVLFSFKSTAQAADIQKVADGMLQLQEKCIHPILQAPYILSIRSGANTAPRSLDSGVTHAFVLEFDSPEHRD